MNLEHTIQSQLAARLAEPGPITLSDPERELILTAFREIAAAQLVILTQQQLLISYDADIQNLEQSTRAHLDKLQHEANAPPASAGYDFAKAQAARAELARRINESQSLREVLGWTLTFIAKLAA